MSKKGIVVIFALISVFLLINGVANFGTVSESEFVYMGVLLSSFMLIVMLAAKLVAYVAEEKVFVVLYCIKKKMMIVEYVSCGLLLLAGLIIRVVVAEQLDYRPPVDTFEHLEVLFPAEKLYHDVVGVFEHFAVSGISGCEMLNIAASMLSILLVYLIVRIMYGRSGGLVVMAVTAFWPSHIHGIIYDNGKYLCTLLFLAAIYFFILFRKSKYWWVFSIVSGVCLGILIYLQTSMYILFVLLAASVFIKGEEGREWSFSENFMKRLPAAVISFVAAVVVIAGVNAMVASALGTESGKITGVNGYAVLSGFNVENNGNENKEDYQYLMDNYQETKNPKDAQRLAMDKGIQRFMEHKKEGFNLMLKKAQYIFGCGYELASRVELSGSRLIYLEDGYYLLILLGTGMFAIELLLRNYRGYINFVIVIGILIVISGAMFMTEGTVQMQFAYIMAICSSAMVSVFYRKRLGDETIRTIAEIQRLQEEEQEKKEKWTSNLTAKLNLKNAGENQQEVSEEKTEEQDAEYYFDEEEIEEDTKAAEEEIEQLLSKLSIDPSVLGTESIREKRRKKIEEAKEKQKNKANSDFDM